jgi:4-amino-4-deoxy-L-arabinose transferase-like glycosyltransferase
VPFTDFLRTAVLLFAGAATALAAVAIAGAGADEDTTLVYVAVAWWCLAGLAGLWLGRRPEVTEGIGRLLASARATQALPELQPGAVLFNRLWSLAAFALVAGGVAFLIPQVPAVACGYCLILAPSWRKQSSAVLAIEQRDGIRFYVELTSPFQPTRLVRTPGFRKNEPAHHDVRA